MEDFMDERNPMAVIIPSFFHSGLSPKFLAKQLGDVAELMSKPNPSGEFKDDLLFLGTVVMRALTDFTTDPCQRAHWCPTDEGEAIDAALTDLD